MNLRQLIALRGNNTDSRIATEMVVRSLLGEHLDLARSLLFPVVHDEIRRIRRQETRRAEDDAFLPPLGNAAPGSDPLSAIRVLSSEVFLDPLSRTLVTWGQASPEQHEARADWLFATKMVPLQRTIDRHRFAAKMLHEGGAGCLDDLAGS